MHVGAMQIVCVDIENGTSVCDIELKLHETKKWLFSESKVNGATNCVVV